MEHWFHIEGSAVPTLVALCLTLSPVETVKGACDNGIKLKHRQLPAVKRVTNIQHNNVAEQDATVARTNCRSRCVLSTSSDACCHRLGTLN